MRNIDETVFLADGARLSGQDITIGKDSAVWYNAVLRASRSPITIGERTNIQDGCILHADHFPIVMGDDVTTGHGAIVHGCTIHSRVLIGMGSILMDDVVGNLLVSQEGYPEKEADLIRQCLMAARKYGFDHLPPADKLRYGLLVSRYEFKEEEAQRLFEKYIRNWGSAATSWRFDAIKDGQVVLSRTACPSTRLHLEAKASSTVLTEGDTYDMALVRLRVLDEFDQVASYAQLPLHLHVAGDAELVGPTVVTAEGGMTGCYVRTLGRAGEAVLTVIGDRMAPVEIKFTIKK